MYAVIRRYGPNADYLISLNDYWGTVCAGDATRQAGQSFALKFNSLQAARAAARKARRACMSWNGQHQVRARMNFTPIRVD